VKPIFRVLTIFSVLVTATSGAQDPPSEFTAQAQNEFREFLPLDDQTDFENARRGFIATLDDGKILDDEGKLVYDLNAYDFLKEESPDSANPSLWRQGQLNSIHGLFKVVDGIYQVRGFDLANMTIVRGKTGWIVIDVLTSAETARAAMALVNKELGERPVSAVIITHSHGDHFGGVKGVVSQEDVASGKTMLIGPNTFFRASVDENILAGNLMIRRSGYMFGNLAPKAPRGTIGTGLGQTLSAGSVGLMEPTTTITEATETLTVDGVEIVFQDTPGAEAPAEFLIYFPKFKAFCQSEELNHVLHNLYTLRGAQVRSGLLWAKHIDKAIDLFGDDVEVSFGSHHWPTWGNAEIIDFMEKQRDLYRYIHDETLRLANHGYTMNEIADEIELPDSLAKTFANREYYGTISHNSKAQYQLYFGWFDGNPAHLNPLAEVDESVKYVEYMGGGEAILKRAASDFEKGDYRFVATVLNHLVFADPKNDAAKELLAKTYVQLGYQAESGPWRNFYLTGAHELRNGVTLPPRSAARNAEMLNAMSLETLYDYFGMLLNGPKAAGKKATFNLNYPDTGQKTVLYLGNGVLNAGFDKNEPDADTTVTIPRTIMNDALIGKADFPKLIQSGEIKLEGNAAAFIQFFGLLDRFDNAFNIVTP